MHPAPIGVADRTGKKYYWRTVPGQHCLLAEGDIGAPIYWRTEAHLRQYIGTPMSPGECVPPSVPGGGHTCRRGGGWGPNTRGQTLWYSRYHVTSFTSPIGD